LAKLFRSVSSPGPVSGNLSISSPTDPAELEADRIAAQVMRMPEDAVPRSIGSASPALHRKCAACNDEEEKLHRSAIGESPGSAPPIVSQVLSQPGQPLANSTRNFFEPRLGADLSAVRVHTDTQAARSADSVHAKAYTVGNSIAFADGQYFPQGESGNGLLAHELVHVVQQGETLRREPDSSAGMTIGTAPASVVAPPEPVMAAPDTSKIDQLLKALEAGDWNVDTLAAELTDAEMRSLSAAVRLRLIRAVSGGMVVGDEDETTIIRLLVTTPDGQVGEVAKGLDPALLRQLEGAIDGDEYKLYQVQLGKLFWRALTPDQASLLTANAKVFPWANPGLLEGTHKGRVSYEKIEINDQGKIVIKYYFVAPYMPALALAQGPFELDPMEVIGVYFLQAEEYAGMEAGQLTYMPAVNLLALYNKLFRQEMGLVTDVALLGLGGAGVVGATTKIGRLVAVLEVALAAADIGIREYRRDIARTEDGKAFLNVWDRVQFLLMIYGGFRLAMTVPTIFRSLRSVWIRWRAAASRAGQEASVRRIQGEVESVLRQSDEVERVAAESPPKPGQATAGPGPAGPANDSPATVPEPASSKSVEAPDPASPAKKTPTVPEKPADASERLLGTGEDYSANVKGSDGVLAYLGNDGILDLYIKAGPDTPKGGQMFTEALNAYDGSKVRGIRGTWLGGGELSSNFDSFKAGILGGMSPADAAASTFTGKMATRAKFTNVKVVSNTSTKVVVEFTK
jgi:hypothetical protein